MIQSRISRHLKILKDAKLLELEKKGRWAYYSLPKEPNDFLEAIFNELEKNNIELPKLKLNCKRG